MAIFGSNTMFTCEEISSAMQWSTSLWFQTQFNSCF